MQPIYELIDNTEAKQYEFHVGESVARIEYIKVQNKIYLTHTEVPAALEGKGIAGALVKAVLEEIDRQDLTLIPLCPFVAGYLSRHPEWKRLVLKGINIE
ncbi:MAG: N-acetyltransferase [Saprospirales bacterium]|nr:N-acetyltransferase [Saprospirales bacterium]MBK8493185.1 N-acetyltransferase [Saprospirales bacterium]